MLCFFVLETRGSLLGRVLASLCLLSTCDPVVIPMRCLSINLDLIVVRLGGGSSAVTGGVRVDIP